MRTIVFVAVALAVALPVIALAPAASAEFAPPNLPPGSSGCGYFHYHSGNVAQGQLPTYHYHHCL